MHAAIDADIDGLLFESLEWRLGQTQMEQQRTNLPEGLVSEVVVQYSGYCILTHGLVLGCRVHSPVRYGVAFHMDIAH